MISLYWFDDGRIKSVCGTLKHLNKGDFFLENNLVVFNVNFLFLQLFFEVFALEKNMFLKWKKAYFFQTFIYKKYKKRNQLKNERGILSHH